MDFGPIYIDHIGIATTNLDEGSRFWSLLGLSQGAVDERVEDQGVKTRFFATDKVGGDAHPPNIELLEPTGADTPIGKFLEKRGAGIQQLCLSVSNLTLLLDYLKENNIQLIDEEPRKGAGGHWIAFVHPRSTGGVLVELTQRESTS